LYPGPATAQDRQTAMSCTSLNANLPARSARRRRQPGTAAVPTTSLRRDIIAIGASAGGLGPLQQVLTALPSDLSAAIFVVVHIGSNSHLAEILCHHSNVPVHRAISGTAIEPGHVYIAVAGCHLLLHDSHILLRRGPRENLSRPAIDPLFRSAACTFGSRVIGVVLSGSMNDGTAGLRAIKRCGGLAVVQLPADAAFPDMPMGALSHIAVDHVVAAHEMGALLARLTREPAGETPEIPFDIRLETAISAQELGSMEANQQLGQRSPFSCPECQGVLWEIEDDGLLRYRCHVGHAFTAEAVQADQSRRAEELLWSLLRNHRERAALAGRMAEREESLRHDDLADMFRYRARGYEEDAEIIRRLLQNGGPEVPVRNQSERP
jgi:two-component system, chemotaxis family, protein-glutamate methylesterase/glutaminase